MNAEDIANLLPESLTPVTHKLRDMQAQRDGAYAERDRCVLALCAFARCLGIECWLSLHASTDDNWDAEWKNVVFIQLPSGQVSWHIHDSELTWFQKLGLPQREVAWDGHTTEQKYERLMRLAPGRMGMESHEWSLEDFVATSPATREIRQYAEDLEKQIKALDEQLSRPVTVVITAEEMREKLAELDAGSSKPVIWEVKPTSDAEVKSMTTLEPPWQQLDAGIFATVFALWKAGFHTTDSGDGISKFRDGSASGLCAMNFPHVYMTCEPVRLLSECDRLKKLVESWGDDFVKHTAPGPVVQATYSPNDSVATIMLVGSKRREKLVIHSRTQDEDKFDWSED